MANLNLYYATMNSGKSIDLIRTAYNYEEKGFKILVLKPGIDTKGGDAVKTRIGLSRKVDFKIFPNDRIIDIIKGQINGVKSVFIDEAQFLTKKQVYELYIISKSTNIDIFCYSLRTNFMMECFEGSAALLEISDVIEEIKPNTLCSCGDIARHVGRKVNGEFVTGGSEVVIDGENDDVEYVPMCGECYLKRVKKIDLMSFREELYGKW